jgi:hypothetical protein
MQKQRIARTLKHLLVWREMKLENTQTHPETKLTGTPTRDAHDETVKNKT